MHAIAPGGVSLEPFPWQFGLRTGAVPVCTHVRRRLTANLRRWLPNAATRRCDSSAGLFQKNVELIITVRYCKYFVYILALSHWLDESMINWNVWMHKVFFFQAKPLGVLFEDDSERPAPKAGRPEQRKTSGVLLKKDPDMHKERLSEWNFRWNNWFVCQLSLKKLFYFAEV